MVVLPLVASAMLYGGRCATSALKHKYCGREVNRQADSGVRGCVNLGAVAQRPGALLVGTPKPSRLICAGHEVTRWVSRVAHSVARRQRAHNTRMLGRPKLCVI